MTKTINYSWTRKTDNQRGQCDQCQRQ